MTDPASRPRLTLGPPKEQIGSPCSESEDRFSKAFHLNPVGMIISRVADGRLVEVNDAFCEMMGYAREQMIGRTSVELGLWQDPADRERLMELFRRHGQVRDAEVRFCPRGGEERVLLASLHGTRLDGEDCFIWSTVDITERLRAEERLAQGTAELRRANERLARAQKAAGAGCWDWDMASGTLVWSEELFRLFGLDPATGVASFQTWRALLHPEDREIAEQRVGDAIRDRRRLVNECRMVLPSGEVRWIEALGDTTYDAAGEPVRMAGICLDVTARRALEGALREAEQRYRLLAAAAFEGIAVSENGRLLDVNERLAAMFGYTRDEMIGREIVDFVAPAHRERTLESLRSIEPRLTEHHCIRKDGTPIILLAHGRRFEAGGRVLRLAALQDVTEQRRVEAELRQAKTAAESANASKSRFLAAASHDLRQPIQALGLFAESLRHTSLDARQQRILGQLEASMQVLAQLLDALLDISRLDAGVVRQQPVVVDLGDMLRRLAHECEDLARLKGLRLDVRVSRRVRPLRADPSLLLGILRNLVANAIRYTERGAVLLAARPRADHWLVQVWDTGVGIAPEHLEPIFDEFYQVANVQRDRTQGLGLGLSIVRRIAALIGCEVCCRSRLGAGSVFELRIPRQPGAVEVALAPATGRAPVAGLGGLRVVLVEDDALVASAWSEWLQALGARPVVFASASEALASADVAEADLYLCDLRLPGCLNGIELLAAIQATVQRPIPGVIVTGDTAAEHIDSQVAAPWIVLHKPVEPKSLLAAIERALGEGESGARHCNHRPTATSRATTAQRGETPPTPSLVVARPRAERNAAAAAGSSTRRAVRARARGAPKDDEAPGSDRT